MPDMRELLEAAYDGEPPMRHSTDDFVAGGRRLRAHQRATWAAGAAGTVLAIAGVAVVPQVVAGPQTVAAGAPAMRYPATAFDHSLTGYTVRGIEVSDPVNVTPGYQQALIRRSDETAGLDRGDGTVERVKVSSSVLTVYRDGVFDPAAVSGGEPVQIGGITGRFLPDTTLAWPYGPGSWAVIRSAPGHLSRDDMVRVAAAMRIGPSRPATLPWRMTYLPAGYQLSSTGLVADDSLTGARVQQGDARFTREPEKFSGLTGPLTGADTGSLRIKIFPRWYGTSQLAIIFGRTDVPGTAEPSGFPSYEPSGDPSYRSSPGAFHEPSADPSMWPNHEPSAGSSELPAASSPARPFADPFCVSGQSRCFRYTADGAYLIEATATTPEPEAELIQVLRGTRIADPEDPATWSGLGEALPGPVR